MRVKTASVDFVRSGPATRASAAAITGGRLFGLDAGDWSMILLGLALSGLLLVLV
ncbi:MAG: hypothetical protein ACRECE_11255 [Xanthobacteraceae bacterium]